MFSLQKFRSTKQFECRNKLQHLLAKAAIHPRKFIQHYIFSFLFIVSFLCSLIAIIVLSKIHLLPNHNIQLHCAATREKKRNA